MQLRKVILPPAISLLLLIGVIYGMGSCMAALPQPYRVHGPWVVETVPEREIVVVKPASDPPLTISLFSWGAVFSEGDRKIGTLKYDRVYYVLADAHNSPVWRMTCHDTYVAVADPRGDELFRIVSRPGGVDLVDAQGPLMSSIVVFGDGASLLSSDGTLLAYTVATPSTMELRTPERTLIRVPSRSVAPAGLTAAALPSFGRLERAALMIMVK